MNPAIDRSDVDSVVVRVHTAPPDRQLLVADAVVLHWVRSPWPDGLLSRNCYISVDGTSVLTYEQWKSTADFSGDRYRRYRSTRFADGSPAVVAITLLTATTTWIDRVLELETEAGLPAGCLAGHVHTGCDGTTLLNLSEWSSLSELEDFLDSGVLAGVFAQAGMPGPPLPGTNNYRLHRGLDRSA
ncbi:hypothetical protein ACWGE0_35235 [Lentzea sp. NPDC054927]